VATSLPLVHGPRRLARQQGRRGCLTPGPQGQTCVGRQALTTGAQSFKPACSGFGTSDDATHFL